MLLCCHGLINAYEYGEEKTKLEKMEDRNSKKIVPIWEKYMLTVEEAAQYFGIGEKKIRILISENINTDYCFVVQVGNKSLINRQKFESFLDQVTSI